MGGRIRRRWDNVIYVKIIWVQGLARDKPFRSNIEGHVVWHTHPSVIVIVLAAHDNAHSTNGVPFQRQLALPLSNPLSPNHSRQVDFCELFRLPSVMSLNPCQGTDFTACSPCNQDNKNNTGGMMDKMPGGLVSLLDWKFIHIFFSSMDHSTPTAFSE